MTLEMLRSMFGWCAVINMSILLWWFFMIVFAHDWIYRIHTKWFKLSVETFDAIHYAGMAFWKLAIFVFNVIPYFALRLIG